MSPYHINIKHTQIQRFFQRSFFLFTLALIFTQCSLYKLKENKVPHSIHKYEKKLSKSAFIIIHCDKSLWQLKNPTIDSNSLKGELLLAPEKAIKFYNLSKENKNFIVSRKEKIYAQQLHIYTDIIQLSGNLASIELKQVKQMEILKKNKGLEALSISVLTLGSGFGGFMAYLAYAWSN
jgi:hypothetical protein